MKKYLFTTAILISALTMSGQEVIWKMSYDVAFPFSATKEFTDHMSWRGLSLDVDRFVAENVAVGMGFAWSTFVEKESDSYYQREKVLLHGTQVRYINNIPLTGRISYFLPLDMFETYFSLGIGTVWQETRREIGTFSFTGNYWQFALAPELGVVLPVGSKYINAKLKYTHAFATSNAPVLSYLSIGLGFAW